jgi:hypothetical protein
MELSSLSINAVIIIVATFTGGDGNDQYVFDTPKFQTKEQCSDYVKQHFSVLNAYVNRNYNYRLDSPNLFYCVDKDAYSKRLKELRNKLTRV